MTSMGRLHRRCPARRGVRRPAQHGRPPGADGGGSSRCVQQMVDQISARLELLRLTPPRRLDEFRLDADRFRRVLEAARKAILKGTIGYSLIVAEKRCD